jgi:hypothetical protein
MISDWNTVIPGPGEIKETAKLLLSLADDPAHVRTAGNGSEFRVPEYLADRYTASFKPRAPRRRKKEVEEESNGN